VNLEKGTKINTTYHKRGEKEREECIALHLLGEGKRRGRDEANFFNKIGERSILSNQSFFLRKKQEEGEEGGMNNTLKV